MLVGILPWYYSQIIKVIEPIELDVIVFDLGLVNIFLKRTNQIFGSSLEITKSIESYAYSKLGDYQIEQATAIISQLKKEFTNFKNGKDFANELLAIKLMELAIIFEKSASYAKKKAQNKHNIEIFHYIWANLDQKITLAKLAQVFYLSESNISKYIKEETGLSFTSLTSLMKLTRLMAYLNFSEASLEELSVILGFKDASHLSKFFKAKTGLSSKDYRSSYHTSDKDEPVISYDKMAQIIEHMVKNYYQNQTIEEFCQIFDLNANTLNKSLKFYVDKSFDDFINYMRIINAARLLLITDDLVSVIAYKVGYNTTKTFYRNFKKIYDINPNDFRKKINYQDLNL